MTAKFVQKRYVMDSCCGWVMRAGAWWSSGGASVPRRAATTPAKITVRPKPPASTTPACRSTGSRSGPRRTDCWPASTAASSTSAISWSWRSASSSCSRGSGMLADLVHDPARHVVRDGEDRPLRRDRAPRCSPGRRRAASPRRPAPGRRARRGARRAPPRRRG